MRILVYAGCVLGLSVVPAALAQGNRAEPDKAMDAAINAFQQGRFAEAESQLRGLLELRPQDAHAWKVLGVVHAAQGQHNLASEPFTKACDLDAKEPDACYYLARNHYLLNRFAESLTMFDRLHAAERLDWRYLNGRGLALSGLGRYAEAEHAFQQAVKQERGAATLDEKPAINLGSLHLRAGNPDRAVRVLREVTSTHPNAARAWFEQGKAELQLEELDAALASLNRAVAARPRYPEAHLLLAKIYSRRGNPQKAAAHRRLAGMR